MRILRTAALLVAAAFLLGACATNVGTQAVNDFGRFQQVVPGVTTKPQIYSIFGQPHTVVYIPSTGESVWSYFQIQEKTNFSTYIPYVGMVTGGSDLNITRADFYFSPEDVFLKSQREQRSKYKNMWLGMGDALTPTGQVALVQGEMEKFGLPFDKKLAQQMAGWADWDD